VNEQTQSFRNTPLHIAAKHGHLLIVKYLIKEGAQAYQANAQGQSAYELAQESAHLVTSQVMSQQQKRGKKPGIQPEEA
jgi:ankyrin repeat protein